jgi:putative endonuclease
MSGPGRGRRAAAGRPAPAWHVYIVRARDGSLYTGVTTDVARRLGEHGAAGGRAARYLRGRSPLELVYRCRLGERGLALSVEWRLKRQPRAAKQAIVTGRPTRRALLRALGVTSPRQGV